MQFNKNLGDQIKPVNSNNKVFVAPVFQTDCNLIPSQQIINHLNQSGNYTYQIYSFVRYQISP
jgi:hypothetical protein